MIRSGRLHKWRGLPASARFTLLAMLLLLPMVSASLKLLGFARTIAVLERISKPQTTRYAAPTDIADAQQLAQFAAIAGKHGLFHATCLRQSLLVHAWLHHRGLQPVLKFGVRRQGASPDMHAWVELNGIALGQSWLHHAPFQPSGTTSCGNDHIQDHHGHA